jgi:hypothetical protein
MPSAGNMSFWRTHGEIPAARERASLCSTMLPAPAVSGFVFQAPGLTSFAQPAFKKTYWLPTEISSPRVHPGDGVTEGGAQGRSPLQLGLESVADVKIVWIVCGDVTLGAQTENEQSRKEDTKERDERDERDDRLSAHLRAATAVDHALCA